MLLKSKIPSTLQIMSLYLANKDTEYILFKPVKVGYMEDIIVNFTRLDYSICIQIIISHKHGLYTLDRGFFHSVTRCL